jgi:hypothetical protein
VVAAGNLGLEEGKKVKGKKLEEKKARPDGIRRLTVAAANSASALQNGKVGGGRKFSVALWCREIIMTVLWSCLKSIERA